MRGLVVVGDEVDGLHVDVGEQFAGDARQTALGVTHGCGRIAIDGAEVALAIDERITQREGLRHADQRVVDGGVAVWVVDTHRLPDNLCALGVLLVVLEAHLAHGVENAAMDGLEAVAGVWECAPDDDRHRVVKIRAAHLLFDIDRDETAFAWWLTAIEGELGVLIVWHRFFDPSERRQKGTVEAGRSSRGLHIQFTLRRALSSRP